MYTGIDAYSTLLREILVAANDKRPATAHTKAQLMPRKFNFRTRLFIPHASPAARSWDTANHIAAFLRKP
jgi:hypothetical protein